MSFFPLSVCGITYQYPNVGQDPYGVEHILWAEAVSNCLTQVYNVAGQNIGSGAGIYAGKAAQLLQFKTLTEGAGVIFTVTGTEIEISASASSYNFQNIGTGAQVYSTASVSPNVDFLSLTAGSGIQITSYPLAGNIEFQNLGLLSLSNSGTNSLILSGGQNPTLRGLIAGSNVTITTVGNDLSISSTGGSVTTGNLTGSTDIGVMNGTNAVIGTGSGLFLTTTGVVAGTYGSSTQIPSITVSSTGRITSVSANSIGTPWSHTSVPISDAPPSPNALSVFSGTLQSFVGAGYGSAILTSGFGLIQYSFTYTGSKTKIGIYKSDYLPSSMPSTYSSLVSALCSPVIGNPVSFYSLKTSLSFVIVNLTSGVTYYADIPLNSETNPRIVSTSMFPQLTGSLSGKHIAATVKVANGDVIQVTVNPVFGGWKTSTHPCEEYNVNITLDNVVFYAEDIE